VPLATAEWLRLPERAIISLASALFSPFEASPRPEKEASYFRIVFKAEKTHRKVALFWTGTS
jgi:hypothetical protein